MMNESEPVEKVSMAAVEIAPEARSEPRAGGASRRARGRRPREPEVVELAVLPVRDRVLFPRMVTPLPVGRPRSLRAIEYALAHDQTILIVAQREPEQDDVGPD